MVDLRFWIELKTTRPSGNVRARHTYMPHLAFYGVAAIQVLDHYGRTEATHVAIPSMQMGGIATHVAGCAYTGSPTWTLRDLMMNVRKDIGGNPCMQMFRAPAGRQSNSSLTMVEHILFIFVFCFIFSSRTMVEQKPPTWPSRACKWGESPPTWLAVHTPVHPRGL